MPPRKPPEIYRYRKKRGTGSLEELIGSSLAQADAPAKILIENVLITETELKDKLFAVRGSHRAMFLKVELSETRGGH